MGNNPFRWESSQVVYWHEEHDGTFLRCPTCGSVLSIQEALAEGCADCGNEFDIAHTGGVPP